MIDKVTTKVWVPVLRPFPKESPGGKVEGDWYPRLFPIAMSQLLSLQIQPNDEVLGNGRFQILELCGDPPNRILERWANPYPPRSYSWICFALDLTYPTDDMPRTHPEGQPVAFPKEERFIFWADTLAPDLRREVFEILFFSGIALPGVLSAPYFYIEIGNRIYEFAGIFSPLHSVDLSTISHDWPPILELEIGPVIRWARGLPGLNEGVGRDRLGRAIAALSYLFRRNPWEENPLDLVYPMLGLEALYAEHSTGIQAQISEKTELLLGPRKTHKKVISRLYDLRSRVLHGDVDIPLSYLLDDYEFAEADELKNVLTSATLILVSTLQHIAQQDLIGIHFEWRFVPEVREKSS